METGEIATISIEFSKLFFCKQSKKNWTFKIRPNLDKKLIIFKIDHLPRILAEL